jgi:hypothetical protein
VTDQPENPAKRRLVVVVKDPAVSIGGGPGSLDDPMLHGGSLRVSSLAGDRFDDTYDLPVLGWKPIGRKDRVRGWKFRHGDPVRKVLLRVGKRIEIVAKGPRLGHSLGANPEAVDVVLTVGRTRYCMRFGGQAVFRDGRRYVAKMAPPPAFCASGGSPSAAFIDGKTGTIACAMVGVRSRKVTKIQTNPLATSPTYSYKLGVREILPRSADRRERNFSDDESFWARLPEQQFNREVSNGG